MKKFTSTLPNWLICSIIIIIGLSCFVVQMKLTSNHSTWATLVGNVGSAILVCGILNMLYDLINKEIDNQNLANLLNVSMAIKRSHLCNVMTDSSEYNFKDIVENAASFSVIINDGLRWNGNNSNYLEKRFSQETKSEFFFVNPDGLFLPALALKTDSEIEFLKNKITQSVALLETTFNRSQRKGTLKIYYLKNYPTQTLFYADNKVIVTPYQTSSGRSIIPLYEYEYDGKSQDSIAHHLYEDLKIVREESELISENGRSLIKEDKKQDV